MLEVRTFAGLVDLPGRRSWGEAWWTARDVCITNEPELPEPLKTLADAFSRRLEDLMINGER